ncbi:uncharacterized protein LOC112687520 [Sipha flava]|uniref:Uncharacterized protein LOC112687520 n=1 Tax=Sipha flava TaxID=143950 RepID=A0A8B8G084_9HEMI|nr:uncharacterized protein LOC112687520 [Sipha flava]
MYVFLSSILECIEFVSSTVTANLTEITDAWNKSSQLYAGTVDKINVTWRAALDLDFLEEFPDIRTRVAKKLEYVGNEQLSILRSLAGRMFHINESLKAKLDQINDTVEQMSFEEHIELKHTVFEHIMWIEDCWKCLHCLYMQLNFSLISLEVLSEESAKNLVDAIKLDKNDKSTIRKSQIYTQSCLSLLKFIENKNKIKINQ